MNNRSAKIISRVAKRYFSDGVSRAAAQLAYYLFFSIFPILILVNSIISRFDVNIIYILRRFSYVLPEQIIDMIVDYLDYLSRTDAPFIMGGAIVMTLYAMTRSLNSLLTSVRQAYRIKKAGMVNYMTAAMLSAFILLSFFLLSMVVLGGEFAVSKLEEYIWIPDGIRSFLQLLKFVLLPVYMFVFLCGFYYIVPSRRYPVRSCMPGAIFAVIGLTVSTALFSYYVSHFSNYSVLYGSIAAVMILMVWLHIVSSILILGGRLNGVIIEMDDHIL